MNLKQAIQAVRSARGVDDADATLDSAIREAFTNLVLCTDYGSLRAEIPDIGDLEIPTRLAFAMHVHLLSFAEVTKDDKINFSSFLNLYYEEWDDWATALRSV
jgi:hypothetical protein